MADLDPVIHQPIRLRIMACLVALRPKEQVDFTHVKKLLDVTDGNLGAHIIKLEEAGYIIADKTFVGRKPKTFLSATNRGKSAFEEHVRALEEIIGESVRPGG